MTKCRRHLVIFGWRIAGLASNSNTQKMQFYWQLHEFFSEIEIPFVCMYVSSIGEKRTEFSREKRRKLISQVLNSQLFCQPKKGGDWRVKLISRNFLKD